MRRYRSSLLPAIAGATVLIGVSLGQPLAIGTTTDVTPGRAVSDVYPNIDRLAQSISDCDLPQAGALLEAESQASQEAAVDPAVPPPSLVLGLAAQSCGHFSKSLELFRSAPPDGAYGDWHLYGLARSTLELGQYSAAKAALDSLRTRYSSSPFFEKAILAASDLARERGDLDDVIEAARQGRLWQLESETSEALEVAAWQAGTELDNASIRRAAAIQLLVEHPLAASNLEVVEEFRTPDGTIEWLRFMTPAQLVQRAESLLNAGLREPAMKTLEDIPVSERRWAWHLIEAQALTASKRGEEALEALEGLVPHNPRQEYDLEWQRAFAALEISAPKSGRNLTSVQRRMMRERAHQHLETAIRLDLDRDRTRHALRILFEDALEDDLFEQALEALRRLKAIDPDDKSGARQLWRLGWKQHSENNYSGAIGFWTELSTLYPTSTYNRSGLYWTARAHEILGNEARSRRLLTKVADVPFTDFYRRHALRRLGEDIGKRDDPQTPTEPWPYDPILSRAERLSSLGLHEAALVEIDALAKHAEPRAAGALRALTLAATGQRRESIIEIKGVFPLLGTPFQGIVPGRARHLYYPLAFDDIIEQHSVKNRLDRNLVLAMIRQESAFDPGARSWAGARGLMQVMPATGREIARRLGLKYSRERLSDPSFSIQLGTTYYRQVRSMFGDDDELSLAGYNAGPYRIKRLWKQAGANAELDRFLETLRLEETKSYVKRVLLFADSYDRLYAEAG
ncbi:MAG: lytic transglycosylase domain-containing protein [bacterium]|nr:lytic transglycosylase domain-containing protein [bacterium]